MDGRFLTAFIIPKRWDIMGYKLKPFSLRYAMTLIAIESPFMEGVAPTTPEHILMLLRVCSSDHPSAAFRSPTLMDYVRVARLSVDQRLFIRVTLQILDYMNTCNACPEVYQKPASETSKKRENVPGPLSMAVSLMSGLNMSADEAWSVTVGQAVWYLTAHSIAEGADIRILNTEEESKIPKEREELLKHQQKARDALKNRTKPA